MGRGVDAPGRPEAVLFDFSGTLFDPGRVIRGAGVAARARRHGVHVDAATAARLCRRIEDSAGSARGRALREACDRSPAAHRAAWIAAASLDRGVPVGLVEAFYASLTDPACWEPFADTRAVLEALAARRVRVGIVSNIGWDVRVAFARAALDPLVDAFVLSCEHGLVKPDGEIFARACQSLGCAPGRALMVGDDPHTDGGAVAVGIPTYVLPALPPAREGPGGMDAGNARVRGLGAVLRLVA